MQADELQHRIQEMAAEVSRDYAGKDLLLIGVLKGAVFFLSDLMRHLDIPCEVDFMAVASYGSSTDSSGVVRILKDLDAPLEGRHVLIVEDIVDSGLTLQYLMRTLEARGPASLEVCALLTKPERRKVEMPARYVGFEIPDKFAIGYGLDYAERYRNLPYVATLTGLPIRRSIGSRTTLARPDHPPTTGSLDRLVQQFPLRSCPAGAPMSRFFKSAAFPIIIVIVLAFFASKLIADKDQAEKTELLAVPHADRDGERADQERHAEDQGQLGRGHAQGRQEVRDRLPGRLLADPGQQAAGPPRRPATSRASTSSRRGRA